MLHRSKIYVKRDPTKESKLYFLFCEGEKRETLYFHFFNSIASQIILQIMPHENGHNSPLGLYNSAVKNLIPNDENKNPEYILNQIDEVWFIVDTDEWGPQIEDLRRAITAHNNWYIAESNPCFEIWLYYHFYDSKPGEQIENWKTYLNEAIPGGFDSRRHPMFIERAIQNSNSNFSLTNNRPDLLCTSVHELGAKILPLVKNDIDAL